MLRFLLSTVVLLVIAAAQAPLGAAAQSSVTLPLDFVATCFDEPVAISGEFTIIAENGFLNPTGGSFGHFTFLESGTGVGLETGTTYTLHGVTSTGFYFRDPGEFHRTASTSTFVQTWVLVPENGGKPLSFQETTVVTFNAEGELVSFKFLGDPDCQ
jgi:hypothetical protein